MSNNIAIEALNQKRKELLIEKEAFLSRINPEINSIETAMEKLSGKKMTELESEFLYDDESPEYIKSSIED
jgi:hypothetical protein